MIKSIQFSILLQFLMKTMSNDQMDTASPSALAPPPRPPENCPIKYLLIALNESASYSVLSLAPSRLSADS